MQKVANRRTTLQDVAREAGVTHVTVHNVLNNKGRVSDEMRARVTLAARKLDYRSNLLARTLKTGRSHGIGVLVYNLASFLASQQLAGVEAAAREAGYHLIVTAHDEDAASAVQILEEMRDRQIDGVISLSAAANSMTTVAEHLPKLQVPFVFGFHTPPQHESNPTADCVVVDDKHGGELAARHLLNLGRRRLLFMGPPNSIAAQQRLEGVRAELRAHDLNGNDVQFLATEGWRSDAARKTLGERWDGLTHPDAIVAGSDDLAAGCLQFLARRGLRVPDDVALVGFDNAQLSAALMPPLTTVETPLQLIGHTCVERLLARLDAPESWQAKNIRLPCQLIVRASCGAEPTDANASQTALQ